jgi:fluoride exporter
MDVKSLLYIMGGGACGSLCRYLVIVFSEKIFGKEFPWGTSTVNILGCFLAGWIFQYLATHSETVAESRLVVIKYALLVGFLGAFTTFSAFGVDTWKLAEAKQFGFLAINLFTNVGVGLASVWLGMRCNLWLLSA